MDPQLFLNPSDLLPELYCSSCRRICDQPRRAGCLHTFCEDCLMKLLASPSTACVVCDTTLSSTAVAPVKSIERIIRRMRMRCPNKGLGCRETMLCEQLRNHIKSCLFSTSKCGKCGMDIIKTDLAYHTANCSICKCPHIDVGCDWIGDQVDLDEHLDGCWFEAGRLYFDKVLDQMEGLKAAVTEEVLRSEPVEQIRSKLKRSLNDLTGDMSKFWKSSAEKSQVNKEQLLTLEMLIKSSEKKSNEGRQRLATLVTSLAEHQAAQEQREHEILRLMKEQQEDIDSLIAISESPLTVTVPPMPIIMPPEFARQMMMNGQTPSNDGMSGTSRDNNLLSDSGLAQMRTSSRINASMENASMDQPRRGSFSDFRESPAPEMQRRGSILNDSGRRGSVTSDSNVDMAVMMSVINDLKSQIEVLSNKKEDPVSAAVARSRERSDLRGERRSTSPIGSQFIPGRYNGVAVSNASSIGTKVSPARYDSQENPVSGNVCSNLSISSLGTTSTLRRLAAKGEMFSPTSDSVMALSEAVRRVGVPSSDIARTLYACGGNNGSTILKSVERYDPLTDVWVELTNMNVAREGHAASTIKGAKNASLFVVGGSNGKKILDSCERYDVSNNRWISISNMGAPRAGLGVCTLGSCLYAVGGTDGHRPTSVSERYDPMVDKWVVSGPMASRRDGLACVAVDGSMYAVGGFDGRRKLATVERYDPVSEKWYSVAPIPTRRSYFSAVALGGYLYVLGGWGGTSWLDVVEKYDPIGNTWHPVGSLNLMRAYSGAATANGHIYCCGGWDGKQWLDSCEVFNTRTGVWSSTSPMTTSRRWLALASL